MKLNFEDVEKDIERWLSKHGREETLSDGQVCIRGYDSAKQSVLDRYFEGRQYAQLVDFVQKGYKDPRLIDKLTDLLMKERNFFLVRKLWSYLSGEERMNYWSVLAVDRFFPGQDPSGKPLSAEQVKERHIEVTIPECRERTLCLLRRYEEILCLQAAQDSELQSLQEDIELIASGHRRKKLKKASADAIDEMRFWQLIDDSRIKEEAVSHSGSHLILLLEQYSGSQIKNFQKILLEKIGALNRWDVWALAYLARDGCSDDAFEAFRTWVVLQGAATFDAVLKDVNAAVKLVAPGEGTTCYWLTQCAHIAYERRQGRALSLKWKDSSVAGAPWTEESVVSQFPHLAKYYGRQ